MRLFKRKKRHVAPCPFCGGSNLHIRHQRATSQGHPKSIYCDDCGGAGGWENFLRDDVVKEIVAQQTGWNKRARVRGAETIHPTGTKGELIRLTSQALKDLKEQKELADRWELRFKLELDRANKYNEVAKILRGTLDELGEVWKTIDTVPKNEQVIVFVKSSVEGGEGLIHYRVVLTDHGWYSRMTGEKMTGKPSYWRPLVERPTLFPKAKEEK